MSERSSHWQLQTIVSQLRSARDQWRAQNGRASGEQGGRELPSRAAMAGSSDCRQLLRSQPVSGFTSTNSKRSLLIKS